MSIRFIYLPICLLALVLLTGCGWQAYQSVPSLGGSQVVAELPKKEIQVGQTALLVEVAKSEAEHAQGLSDRESLPQDAGMIFIFDKPEKYSFWMNRMHFPLDFIWLNDSKIVEISANIQAPTANNPSPAILTPKELIDAVIEVNAGWVEQNNIKVGQEVKGLTGL